MTGSAYHSSNDAGSASRAAVQNSSASTVIPASIAYRVDPTTGAQTAVSLAGGSIAGPGNNAAGQSDWIFVFQADPLPVPDTSLLNIMVAGTEQQAESVSVMIGGVEVPVVSITVMQGGIEVPVA